MKYLVTGGTGFIGSNLALELIRQGHEVFITGTKDELFPKEFEGKLLQKDFSTLDWKKIGKLDCLFHQAAITNTLNFNKEEMFQINLENSKILFKKVIENDCKNIVYASSTAVYGDTNPPYKEEGPFNPLNPYAESKLELDKFVLNLMKEHPDVKIVGLRYCNVYGPGEYHKGKMSTMIYQLSKQMQTGNPKIFKHGEQKRDYIYVKDVVTANLLASKAKESCIVNCGYGKATTFNEIISILNKTLDLNKETEYIDNPYEKTYQNYTECDMTLAKEKIEFVPRFGIESGIKDYYETGFLTK